MRFIGLELSTEEDLVWAKIQERMTLSGDQIDAVSPSHSVQSDGVYSRSATPSGIFPSIKSTGRHSAAHTNKIKPSVLTLIASEITESIHKRKMKNAETNVKKSFTLLDDDDSEEDNDYPDGGDHDFKFFGTNIQGGKDSVTSHTGEAFHSLNRRKRMPFAPQASLNMIEMNSKKLFRSISGWWYRIQSLEGLLHLKRKWIPKKYEEEIIRLEQGVKKRPFFTYWLMFANIIILLITLSVYRFAPYGWDIITKEALVQKSNLALEVSRKNVTGNVWGGPSLEALVLLGAKYAPCMRRDRQLYRAIESDWLREANSSGCCVRRDKSGCVQVLSDTDCVANYADFVYQYNETNAANVRAVCGTSPYTCKMPSRITNPNWKSPSISNWPICLDAGASSASHLTCELTGRPCCVGILAVCLITTREHCDFLGGHFNQTAFLCSQVDCLSAACGLLPFGRKNQPDQVYRLWLSLFLHAGILHIILTLLFDFLVLRTVEKKLGWFKTLLLYVLSGVGGNIISAVFVPYYPEVGPGPSIFGIIAYIFVFVFMENTFLENVWRHIAIMFSILVIALALGVMLPVLDNYAHIGGFVFGFFLSFIFVQYLELKPTLDPKGRGSFFRRVKCVMIPVSFIVLLLLYIASLVWFYKGQENWYGFTFLNCIPYTSTFCVDYGQNLERVQILP